MIIAVHSAFTEHSVAGALGDAEYSYWFVRRAFEPLLAEFGVVVPVSDPAREVPMIAASAAAHGEDVTFLSFEPPHKIVPGLPARTIPVFAWEFDTIPDEAWDGEPRNDWRGVLRACGSAITHSTAAAEAVRRALGAGYDIAVIPAPVHATYCDEAAGARAVQPAMFVPLSAAVLDSERISLGRFAAARLHGEGTAALGALADMLRRPGLPRQAVGLEGVVYTAVLNPFDGRKNVTDLIAGFVIAFREVPGATLVIKATYHDAVRGLRMMLADLAKLGRFRCRVVIVQGLLPDAEYRALIRATSYVVNTATNEGQCLPLMEFMSAARPAIAPDHTAMRDYLDADNAFVLPSAPQPTHWPHDRRSALRTLRHRIDFAALVGAFRESYAVARRDAGRYAAMSAAAEAAQRRFCGTGTVRARVARALSAPAGRGQLVPEAAAT